MPSIPVPLFIVPVPLIVLPQLPPSTAGGANSPLLPQLRFLRHYPLVRLCFVLYLLLLHVWVFVVIAVHTHSLELDARPQDSILGPGNRIGIVRSGASS
jgi:hypothetical protein